MNTNIHQQTPRAIKFDHQHMNTPSIISSVQSKLGKVFSRLRGTPPNTTTNALENTTSPSVEKKSSLDVLLLPRKSTIKKQSLQKNEQKGDRQTVLKSHSPMRVTFKDDDDLEKPTAAAPEKDDLFQQQKPTTTTSSMKIGLKRKISSSSMNDNNNNNNEEDDDYKMKEFTDEEYMIMENALREKKRRRVIDGADEDRAKEQNKGAVVIGEFQQQKEGNQIISKPFVDDKMEDANDALDHNDDNNKANDSVIEEKQHSRILTFLQSYKQKRYARKSRLTNKPKFVSNASVSNYNLFQPRVVGNGERLHAAPTSSAKLAPPFRANAQNALATSVLRKRDPRIISTPGPVSIGFAQGERSKKRSRGVDDDFMPASVTNRNVARKLDNSSTPLSSKANEPNDAPVQTPRVDLSAMKAQKEKMATQTASKILRALDKASEYRSGATPVRNPAFTPMANGKDEQAQPPSRLRASTHKGLNVSFADNANTPSPAQGFGSTAAPASHRMSTPYPNGKRENPFSPPSAAGKFTFDNCDDEEGRLTSEEFNLLENQMGGKNINGVFEFGASEDNKYATELIDEDDDISEGKEKAESDSESEELKGVVMGPGTAQKQTKPSTSLNFGSTKTTTMTMMGEDKSKEVEMTKAPVVNLWGADFMAKNKAHQEKVRKAIEEEENGGGLATKAAAPSPFAPTSTAAAPSPFAFGIPAIKKVDESLDKTAQVGFSFGTTSTPSAAAVIKQNPFLTSVVKPTEAKKSDSIDAPKPTFNFRVPEGPSIGSDVGEVKPSTAKFTFGGSTPSLAAAAPIVAAAASKPPSFSFGSAPAAIASEQTPSPTPTEAATTTGGSGLLSFLASTKPKEEDKPKPLGTFTFGTTTTTTTTTPAPFKTLEPATNLESKPAFAFGGSALVKPIETKKGNAEVEPPAVSAFGFGVPQAAKVEAQAPFATKPASFTFGASETKVPFSFGNSGTASAAAAAPITSSGGLFGAPVVATASPASAPFTFSAAKPVETKAPAPFSFGASAAPVVVTPATDAPPPAASGGGFNFGAATTAPKPLFSFNAGSGAGAVSSVPNPFAAPSSGAAPIAPSPFGGPSGVNLFGGGSASGSRPSSPFGAPGANPFGGGGAATASLANPFSAPAAAGANMFGMAQAPNPFGAPAAGTNPFGAQSQQQQQQQQQQGSFNAAPTDSGSSGQVGVPGGRKPIRRAKRPARR